MTLRKFRIIIAAFFIFMFAFIFVDFLGATPIWLINALTRLQFTPSLINFIATLGILSTGFIFIIALNLIWGRVFCSFLCPLGILQDVFSRINLKFRKRKIYRFVKPHNFFRYAVLSITALSVLFGSMFLLNFLDPYSNFGKIFSTLVRPIVVEGNNIVSKGLDKVHLYWIFPIELKYPVWQAFGYPAFLFILLLILTWQRGRLFCNTLCPVGTLLSLFSRISFFKIKIDQNACTRCGKCSTVCKAECIDVKNKKVDFSRCVTCFNCVQVCSENGIHYTSILHKKQPTSPHPINTTKNDERRMFFGKIAIAIGGLSGGLLSQKTWANQHHHHSNNKPSKIKNEKHYAICPPGSISQRNFLNRCTGCQLCVSSCPTHVLQPSVNEYGITSVMVPTMDFHQSFCNYECTKCSEVCPTGAIMPLNVEQKKVTQTGVVLFIKESCVVYTNETSCGACSEHCPTKAIQMVPYKDSLTIPNTNQDICIGCGACEYACPVRPYRAIYVDGNNIHKIAKKPNEDKLEDKLLEDFPF